MSRVPVVLWKAEQRAFDEGLRALLQQALQNSDLAYDLPYMLACQQRVLFGRERSVGLKHVSCLRKRLSFYCSVSCMH